MLSMSSSEKLTWEEKQRKGNNPWKSLWKSAHLQSVLKSDHPIGLDYFLK